MSLITDRNNTDLQAILYLKNKAANSGWDSLTSAEKAQWNTDLKGAYNASDLNRVGNAINEIAGLLNTYGYSVSVAAKTNWAENQLPPSITEMNAYLSHISILRASYAVKATTPVVPASMNSLNIAKANSIEQILLDISELIENMITTFWCSAELIAGENL